MVSDDTSSKSESASSDSGSSSDSPSSSYSRGENQKPVSRAYKDNWNAIFSKSKKKTR